MTGRYVVGFDGSLPAEAALSWAVRRTERERVPLVVAHVDEVEDGIMGRDFREITELSGAELLESAAARLALSHPQLEVGSVVLSGSPVWALARFADANDTLVIGTHGTRDAAGAKARPLDRRALGSRSVQIAMSAACTVAVIPVVDLRFRSGVVAGIDREVTATALGRLAAEEAQQRGEILELLHLTSEPAGPSTACQSCPPIELSAASAREQAPSLIIRSRVSTRSPAEALLDAARGSALLILGQGSLDRTRSPVGSTMHEILLNATAPVLIARTAELA